jgi:hydrogenase expression/formation protein HypD
MKHINPFRDREAVRKLAREIKEEAEDISGAPLNFMEVCGTHTMAIGRYGIRKLLPTGINLLSGPGCPVCVTPDSYIDKAVLFSRMPNTIIATFGDMMRVPGSFSSLEKEKAEGSRIEVIYSPLDSLNICEKNPESNVILLGIGFETTAPAVALTLKKAHQKAIKNFYLFSGHKLITPAMEALLTDKDVRINGFLCPGHVSVITGSRPYGFIPERYGIPCVIAGFEPVDILQSVLMLLRQKNGNKPSVEVEYTRVVKKEGNRKAREIMEQVFQRTDSEWRGLGLIRDSGLEIRGKYSSVDAEKVFPVDVKKSNKDTGCICGEILKGKKTPVDCKLFRRVCTPENPIGPCMVSSEGTCAAFYRYGET